jgi:ketosteroid isomerase-like protein
MQNGIKNIKDFFRSYEDTAFRKDIPGMINLYDDNIVTFDMWDKGYFSGLKEWSSIISDWLTSLTSEKVKVSFEMIDVQEGEDVGFASAIIQFQALATDDSVQRSMRNRITLGFIKKDGFWKVKHQHTSAPINSDLQAILDI